MRDLSWHHSGLCGVCARSWSTVAGALYVHPLGPLDGGYGQPQGHNFSRGRSIFPQVCQLHPQGYTRTHDWRKSADCCTQGNYSASDKAHEYCRHTEPFLPPPPSIYGPPPVEVVGCLRVAGLLVGRAETIINNPRPHHHHPLLPHTPLFNLLKIRK